jgi:hypothetical protein
VGAPEISGNANPTALQPPAAAVGGVPARTLVAH